MGCLFVIVLGGASAAMILLFGYHDWVLIVLGLLWLAALVASILRGHVGFGGHGNTDLQIVIAGLFIAAAIVLPRYAAQKHCDQAKIALSELAHAENKYFAEHKAYTATLNLLNLTPDPNIQISVSKADAQSFTASASHSLCTRKADGALEVFMWDSSRGALQ
jgi:Tfp pilus assembly protein PilE